MGAKSLMMPLILAASVYFPLLSHYYNHSTVNQVLKWKPRSFKNQLTSSHCNFINYLMFEPNLSQESVLFIYLFNR